MTSNPGTPAIAVSHLKKTYGRIRAVEDVSFVVNAGKIFGMLGPNGAGKTTTVECITGLRHPDGGTVSVLGLDPRVDGDALHPVDGVQLQSSTFPDRLKVNEILDLYQSFYRNPENPDALAHALGLGEKLGSYYKTLSGGQRQRLAAVLLDISSWTPLGASVDAIQSAMPGAFPSLPSLLVLIASTLDFGYLSVRYFNGNDERRSHGSPFSTF